MEKDLKGIKHQFNKGDIANCIKNRIKGEPMGEDVDHVSIPTKEGTITVEVDSNQTSKEMVSDVKTQLGLK